MKSSIERLSFASPLTVLLLVPNVTQLCEPIHQEHEKGHDGITPSRSGGIFLVGVQAS